MDIISHFLIMSVVEYLLRKSNFSVSEFLLTNVWLWFWELFVQLRNAGRPCGGGQPARFEPLPLHAAVGARTLRVGDSHAPEQKGKGYCDNDDQD